MDRKALALALALAVAAVAAWAGASQGRLLHHRSTPFGDLYVYEEPGGLRSLRHKPGGARQSVFRPERPDELQTGYTRMALAGVALLPEPRRMLVVGLGGGSLPRFLHLKFPKAAVDVVEIEAQVLDVARQYFGFATDPRLRVHIADARHYIARAPPGGYDLIVLDAFADADVPAHLATAEFLNEVRRALSPAGVVISNLWNRANNRSYDDMLATHRAVFDSVATLKVAGDVNVVVLALPRRERLDRERLRVLARDLDRARGLRFDLAALVDEGYVEERVAGRVLHDTGR